MKRAFTLIELLVSISIVMLLSAGAFVYINQGIQRQNLLKISSQVVSDLKMARSLAKTKQVPSGTNGDLQYIRVNVSGGNLVFAEKTTNNSSPISYSSKKVGAIITISSPSSNQLYFYASNGFLGKSNGSFYGLGQTAVVSLSLTETKNMSTKIIVDSFGQVREEEVNED